MRNIFRFHFPSNLVVFIFQFDDLLEKKKMITFFINCKMNTFVTIQNETCNNRYSRLGLIFCFAALNIFSALYNSGTYITQVKSIINNCICYTISITSRVFNIKIGKQKQLRSILACIHFYRII